MASPANQSKKQAEPPKVAIVITNWNGRPYLAPCLTSLVAQDYQDFELFVVDNASTDDSVAWLRANFPQIHVIQNQENVGLCAANNQGILASQAEFVAIINNDTEFEPGWLGHLVRAIQSEPEVGMCASKMLLTDRRDMIESAGIVVDRAGIAWGLETGQPDESARSEPMPVFGACGGGALYRRKMLLEIGLFDEAFFVYLEDADVAWRGRWAGWKCLYVPQAVMYHAHSATIKEGSPFKTRLLARNKVWMILKNYPLPYLLLYSPLILLYELMAIGYNILAGRGSSTLKGRLEAIGQMSQMLAKRRQVVRRLSAQAMMAQLHPAQNPLTLLRNYLNIADAVKSQSPMPRLDG